MDSVSVLIVEDDPMVMEIHKRFVLSSKGYSIAGTVGDGLSAISFLEKNENTVDLVILDIFMPELDGVETLRKIRQTRKNVDVIIVSAAHEADTVRKVIRHGAFDYIVKPFTYERFRKAMEAFRVYHCRAIPDNLSQDDIDSILSMRRNGRKSAGLPKGLCSGKLDRIRAIMKSGENSLSADEMAELAGVSRVTARRYLEYLVSSGIAVVEQCYGEVGRPVNRYRLI
jgi:two-component system response regulator DctR